MIVEKEVKKPATSKMNKKKHIGSSFEGFLKEEGIFEEATVRL
jgi:hypothetical protein